ncbi:MAG: protein-L-isoaspartate O-methyltransferase [Halobacteriales archaeon]|nr:protein-L-isoaspartate O-methyltransferase [Halobacteriales archaeon]
MDLAVLRDDLVDGLVEPPKEVLTGEALTVAMREVPRHRFVPAPEESAYEDRAFDYEGTTVLAPSLVARLLEALAPEPGDRVLVVGAGTGYTTALAAELAGAANVSAVDIARELVLEARRNLARAGYGEALVDCRDGADGLPEYAPFDRMLVEAAAVRPPRALLDQLAPGGRLVMPLGTRDQSLAAIDGPDAEPERLGPVRFKPLLVDGEQAGGLERNRTAREESERQARAAERRRGWEQDWIDWDAVGDD